MWEKSFDGMKESGRREVGGRGTTMVSQSPWLTRGVRLGICALKNE